MRFLKLTIYGLLISFSLQAQQEIRGIVRDTTNAPVAFANVVLSGQNDNMITGTITDEDGSFELSAPKGDYKLAISFIGYEKWIKTIALTDKVDLGIILLKESTNELDEVIIRSNIISKKGDKLIMNVGANELLKGRNTMEILKYAPYLSVDSNSGSISMKGKASTILVNGRAIQVSDIQTYLETLSSENVASIEIISNPSSRYEASGGGGVINIITKTPKKGIEGNFNNRVDLSKFTSYNSQLTLNSKLSERLIVNTLFNYNDRKGFRKEDRLEILNMPNITYDYDKTDILESDYYYLSAEAIYDMSKHHQIGLGIAYLNYNNSQDQNNDLVISENGNQTTSDGDYLLQGDRNYLNLNFNHSVELDTIGQHIKTIIDYYDSDRSSNNTYENVFFDTGTTPIDANSRRSNSSYTNEIFSIQSDFVKPLDKSKWEVGGKYSSVTSESAIVFRNLVGDEFVIDDNLTNDFNYTEQILAGYVMFAVDSLFKSNVSLQLGTRLEYTDGVGAIPSENYEATRNYLDFFPSVFLNKDLENNNSVSVSYTRRIDRPSYNSFNPTIFYLTDFTSQIGNPELQPSYTNSFEISYNTSNINILGFYDITNGEPREILKRLDESTIQYQWRNIDNSDVYGVYVSGSKKLFKEWLNIFTRASFYRKVYTSSFDDDVDNINSSKNTFQGRISLSAEMPLKIKTEFAFEYNGPETYGQYESGENYAFYLNFSKRFNKNFSAYLNITDVFDNLRYVFKNNQRIVQTSQYRNNYSTNYAFSVVYTFGIGSNVRKQNLNNSNRNLRNRTN